MTNLTDRRDQRLAYLALLDKEIDARTPREDPFDDGTADAMEIEKTYTLDRTETPFLRLKYRMETVSVEYNDEEAGRWLQGFVAASEIIDRLYSEAYGEPL